MRRQRAVAPSTLLFLLFSSSCFSLPASRRGPASSRVSPFASSLSNRGEESYDDKVLVGNRTIRRKLQVEDRSRYAFVELFPPESGEPLALGGRSGRTNRKRLRSRRETGTAEEGGNCGSRSSYALDGASCKCTGARHRGAGGGRSFEPAALVRRQY